MEIVRRRPSKWSIEMRLSYLMIIILPILLIACGSDGELQLAQGATYYVDATGGNDSNTGSAADNAWKSMSKINSSKFLPGDQILFKRGEFWRETLLVPSSGSQGNPIVFGAYGSGNKPTILGSDAVTLWTNIGGNAWEATVTTEPQVVWFNGIDQPPVIGPPVS